MEQANNFNPYEDWSRNIDYVLDSATMDNINVLETYKLNSILDYANNLSKT